MTLETKARRVVTYQRVSSDSQRERETIKTQGEALAARLGVERGIELIAAFADDGVSGMKPLAQRPGGKELLAAAAAHRFDELWLYRLDRLGRNLADTAAMGAKLTELGITVVTLQEGRLTPFMLELLALLAQNEHRVFLERSRDGIERAAGEGRYTGGIVAYGLRVEGLKQTARLVPDDTLVSGGLTAAGVTRRIFERIGLGHVSCGVVADELNALGVPTLYSRAKGVRAKRTRGRWTAGRVRSMVINPVYAGDLQYGRRTTKHDQAIISARIEPLVPEDLWLAAQETLARNRVCAKNTPRIYLLRGVIHCAICGLTYVGSQGRQGVTWYRCNGRTRDRGPLQGTCTGPYVRGEAIEPVIWAEIERYLRNPGAVLEELAHDGDTGAALAEAESLLLRRSLRRLEDERARAVRLAVTGILTDSDLKPELDRISGERSALEARLAAVEAPEGPGLPDSATNLLAEVHARLEAGLSPEARQEIVRLLVGRIEIRSETGAEGRKVVRALVEYRFPGLLDIDTGTSSSRRQQHLGIDRNSPQRDFRYVGNHA